MTLASRLAPAASLGPDSGQHGGHCYSVLGILVCGFPELHTVGPCNAKFGAFDLECDKPMGHNGQHADFGADLPHTIYW
jgi:hypothetical protein